jgi:hypothetical protein
MPIRFLQSLLCLCLSLVAMAAPYNPQPLPIERLPTDHPWQVTLRDYLATLTADDFKVVAEPLALAAPTRDTDAMRLWLLTQQNLDLSPAGLPPEAFTLKSLESQVGLAVPTNVYYCQSLAWLAHWDYPGNTYHGLRALKLRALMLTMVDVMMLDYQYATDPQGADRSDYLGGNLIWCSYTLLHCGEVLPEPVRAALATGLCTWGPKGLMTDMDLFAPVGVWYLSQALPDLKPAATDYARPLFSDPKYYNQAGYFVDNGCFDTSYNGISLYFGSWAAIVSDWPFARQAMLEALRLRSYLCFPEPDGGLLGPSSMSSRTSGDPPHDQWQFTARMYGSACLSADARAGLKWPNEKELAAAVKTLNNQITQQLKPVAEAKAMPWQERHWGHRFNFAAMDATDAQLQDCLTQAAKEKPPLSRYLTDERFVRAFGDAFVIAHYDTYAVAIHTGQVGRSVGHMGRPYGFGGGQISVFWTPTSGTTLLGRRKGVQGDKSWDSYEDWRNWPVHAVTGWTADQELISSNRLEKPTMERQLSDTIARITLSGNIPKYRPDFSATVPSGYQYQRRFEVNAKGVTVTTTVSAEAGEFLQELYETLPVFNRAQANQKPAIIEVLLGDTWQALGDQVVSATSLRLGRHDGTVLVQFTQAERVKLSPQPWQDGYMSRVEARPVLVDLLTAEPRPQTLKARTISYTISPAPPNGGK